ncbi:MAG: PKD domain-containing protein [Ferruginibacter sp.]
MPGTFAYSLVSVTDASSTLCTQTQTGTATVTVNQLASATISGTTQLCLNAPQPNITFTATGGVAPFTFTYQLNSGPNQTITTTTGNTVTLPVSTAVAGTFIYTLVSVQESSSVNCVQPQTGTATVIVDPQPTASFTTTAPYCEAKDVTFTPTFGVSSGSVVSWLWNYGDGTGPQVRTNGNPFTVNYATAGPKTVTFQTVSDKGCLSTVFTQIITINAKPLAGFISPEICLLDPFAQFTDTSSVAPPSTVTAWEWNFGDMNATPGNPNTSTLQDPTHIYTAIGNYTIEQIVTTNSGCKDTIQQVITISDGNPVANFIVLNPATLCSNDTVRIQNKSTIGSGLITKLEIYWDYVNQPSVFDLDNVPVFDKIYKHKYPTLTTAQNYTIQMRAYSGGLCFSTKQVVITVNAAPVVQLNSIPDVCLNNGTVQFNQGSETAGVAGSGVYSGLGVTPGGLFNPLTAGVGPHVITYTYTSNFGCTEFKTTNVKVLQAPVAIFATTGFTCQNNVVTFTESSTPGTGTLNQWTWNWGDMSPSEVFTTGGPRTHTYTGTGSFTATLTVMNTDGCKSTTTPYTFTVNPQPQPDFTFTPVACLPQAVVNFTNTTSPVLSNWNYQWSFALPSTAPGDQSTAINPSHLYTSVGPYSVRLIATSNTGTGCTNSIIKTVNAVHPAPVASFSVSQPTICVDKSITVTDLSTFADGTPTSWSWNYGDLSPIRTGQVQPPHTYTAPGNYTITLNITNSFGCTDDTSRPLIVYPYPVISAGPDQIVLQGGSVIIPATASGNDLVYQWTPGTYLNSTTVLQPTVTPFEDITYTLTVTARGGCSKSDNVFIEVLKAPVIPNTFTPNKDGFHDVWEIKYLFQYPGNRVQVFTRTGALVFESRGYTKPWDGTKNGQPLPFDTYYYIIEPFNGRPPFTGYVTIIK